jgi:signal transduction histidine kinase
MYDTKGTIYAVCGISTDITELKQAQQALRQSHEQLQVINQDLERANQVKAVFLRMMSHELRTPLNPILGMSESLQEGIFGPLNQRQTKAVTLIVDNSNCLLTSINSILDLVDLEASRIQLDCNLMLVKDLCTSSLAIVESQAAAKSIQLQTDISPEITLIQADSDRMKQILTQLLDNAIKFSKTGGTVSLAVQMQQVDASQSSAPRFVQFSIQDRGIGIAPENLTRLFQFFTQLDDRLSRDYEGIGIGLALAQRLTELHEGHITVESQIRQGSCFTVNIPV